MLKVQTHNLVTKTHTVKAGSFPVQIYILNPDGLYVERNFVDHPVHKHWKAHILPELHLQICRFTPHSGAPEWDYYIDIIEVEEDQYSWQVQDLYLDLTLSQGKLNILDTDEFFEAVAQKQISLERAALATQTLHDLVNLLAQHDYDLDRALAIKGLELSWDWQPLSANYDQNIRFHRQPEK